MYNLRHTEFSENELDDAFHWYDSQGDGLGYRFLEEINSTLSRVIMNPEIYVEIKPGIRRALVKFFPYGIIFAVDKDDIMILSVAHLHRRPFYWIDRIG